MGASPEKPKALFENSTCNTRRRQTSYRRISWTKVAFSFSYGRKVIRLADQETGLKHDAAAQVGMLAAEKPRSGRKGTLRPQRAPRIIIRLPLCHFPEYYAGVR
jgi:hypothetical protein